MQEPANTKLLGGGALHMQPQEIPPAPPVEALHDLSGFGRCSLAVILPVLSCMGAQVVQVPTAVLSSHTGGLGDPVLRDLSDMLLPTLQHYRQLGLDFAAVYSGFFSSAGQVSACRAYCQAFPQALKVIDPVMGDDQKAYRTCTGQLMAQMRPLIAEADVITPNETEAAILLGEDHTRRRVFDAAGARRWLVGLAGLGCKSVVITGCHMPDGRYNLVYSGGAYSRVRAEYLPVGYPGTGDIFTSALTGRLLGGDALPQAASFAAQFVERAIALTQKAGTDRRWGVQLEKALPWLFAPELQQRVSPL